MVYQTRLVKHRIVARREDPDDDRFGRCGRVAAPSMARNLTAAARPRPARYPDLSCGRSSGAVVVRLNNDGRHLAVAVGPPAVLVALR